MGAIQDEVNKRINDLPRQLASEMVDKKLHEQKVELSKEHLEELVNRLLAGKGNVQFDTGGSHKEVNIEFTDKDMAALDKRVQKFIDELPAIITNASESISLKLLISLKKKWRTERRLQRRDVDGFRKRLDQRWGAGLESMRILVTIAREFGDGLNKDGSAAGGGSNPQTFDILRRLHARACQVAEEVICLLSNGFADGAMARWRTMHEIAAVSFLIGQHGDKLAERYIAHQLVETRAAALQYGKHQKQLGQEPLSGADLDTIENSYQAALQTYGEPFAGQYGWAAEHLGKKRPSIADIQEAASIGYLSPYYKMASHNVHANPKGVFFKLGLIGESEVLLAGPSNAGLADPGHAAALSLMQISSVLMKQNPAIDNMIAVKVMQRLVEEIGDALMAAHEKLFEDASAKEHLETDGSELMRRL